MTARVEIQVEERAQALFVPLEAVFEKEGRTVAYVARGRRAGRARWSSAPPTRTSWWWRRALRRGSGSACATPARRPPTSAASPPSSGRVAALAPSPAARGRAARHPQGLPAGRHRGGGPRRGEPHRSPGREARDHGAVGLGQVDPALAILGCLDHPTGRRVPARSARAWATSATPASPAPATAASASCSSPSTSSPSSRWWRTWRPRSSTATCPEAEWRPRALALPGEGRALAPGRPSAVRALGRRSPARGRGPRARDRAEPSSSPTSPPATSTRTPARRWRRCSTPSTPRGAPSSSSPTTRPWAGGPSA